MNGYEIKQSSTGTPLLFLLISSADHIAGLTGKAGSVVVKLSKNGGTYAAPAGAVTEIGGGLYQVAGNATDTGTIGPLWLNALDAASDPCDVCYRVVAYDPASATGLGLSNLDAAVSTRSTYAGGPVASVTGSVGSVTGSVASVTAPVTVGGYTGAGVPADPWATTLPGAYTGGTAGAILGVRLDVMVSSRSVYAGGAVASVTAPVTVGTNTDKAGYSLATPPPTAGAIATAVWTDTLAADFAAAGSPGKVLVTQLGGAFGSGTSVYTAAALANAPTGGGSTDPWSTSLPGSYPPGSAGSILGGRLDVAVSTRSTYAGGPVASVTSPVTVGGYSGGAAPADPWTAALPGAYAGGSAGAILGNRLDLAVSTRAPAATALSTADWTAARADRLDDLDAAVSTRSTYAGGPVASVTAPVAVGTIADKAGYSLSPAGLDEISTAAPTGPAATFREMVVQVWRRFYRRSVKDMSSTTIRTYGDDGTTVLTTQAFTDDGLGSESLGAAS